MYHNTLAHEGDQLRNYEQKALSQDERILAFYQNLLWGDSLSYRSDQIWHHVFDDENGKPSCPEGSVRRSLTNLTNQGDLVMSETLVTGQYGHPVHTWRLAGPVQGELL